MTTSSGLRTVKRRIFSAKGGRFNHLDAVLALIAGGMSVKAACRSKPHFPTAAQFNCRLRTDPALRARFEAVCARAGQGRPNLGALDHADEILKLIEGGMSARRACASDSRFPSRGSFVAALRYNPDLELRYDLALARRERPHAKALAAFDEIERRIIAGGAILQILNSDRTRFPDYTAFAKFLKTHPEFDARYRAAGRTRQAGPNALRQGPAYSANELRRAATALMLSNARGEVHTSRLAPGGIHTQSLLRARFRNPELLVAVESAVVARRTRLHLVNGRPKIDPANVRLVAPSTMTVRGLMLAGERHAAALSQNDLWRRAVAVLPRALDRDARDDIASAIVLAILEGAIDISMIASEAQRLLTIHNRERFDPNRKSLDAPIGADSAFSLADVLSNNWD
ncbi:MULTISPECIES: hypothetical protein [Rhodopseudomonas]|uniref:Uncharacterized protein n=2 Tax=Rhodopseudomonas TaxID=1073 RepID=A0A0D7ELC0_RHOPL|nr:MULTISPECIES: hypothetical protein [Rhodopseudomonas]KIZ41441.1 hypothetical protein OO17_15160 [Rhodopseudomonas palustris]WOK18732.1 hypothetical protein RBJ75_04170 [Rhodopseudomonas sp. BAL398]